MRITVKKRRLPLQIDKQKIQCLAQTFYAYAQRYALRNEVADFNTVTLIITGNAGITQVNRLALNHEDPTDVITLTYAATPASPATAEIFVNAQRAIEVTHQTRTRVWSPDHELALYIAHGFDHLAGNDDTSPADARNMRKRERNWVRRADTAGDIKGLMLREKA